MQVRALYTRHAHSNAGSYQARSAPYQEPARDSTLNAAISREHAKMTSDLGFTSHHASPGSARKLAVRVSILRLATCSAAFCLAFSFDARASLIRARRSILPSVRSCSPFHQAAASSCSRRPWLASSRALRASWQRSSRFWLDQLATSLGRDWDWGWD